jgi:hypothetical protein
MLLLVLLLLLMMMMMTMMFCSSCRTASAPATSARSHSESLTGLLSRLWIAQHWLLHEAQFLNPR